MRKCGFFYCPNENVMDANQISQLVTTLGFPIVATIFIWKFMTNMLSKSEERSVEREREMGERINQLEDRIEHGLTELVKQQGQVIKECTTALRDSHALIASVQADKDRT